MPLLFRSMLSTVHQRVVIGIKVQLLSVPSYAMRILLFVMPGVPLVFVDVSTFHPFIWIGDTESRPDVKHGCVADRASPRVLVEVHPCAGECAISVKRCPHQAERPIVIGVRLHDSNGRVSFDIFERPVVFKHIARFYICLWASVFHCLEQRLGYGITPQRR